MSEEKKHWWIYKGVKDPHDGIQKNLPPPPKWREFKKVKEDEMLTDPPPLDDQDKREIERHIGNGFQVSEQEIKLVNAALYLRRPLLVTGKPGSGKSSLAYAVAHELNLGRVLRWPITTQSTLTDGLYRYDAMGRLEDATSKQVSASSLDIGQYLRLGPLGTALLPWEYPRVLLIDEIDKGSIDLPNDLLNIFEEGEFEISKLVRISKENKGDNEENKPIEENKPSYIMPYDGRKDTDRVPIRNGRVQCSTFPFVILTSNGEREFPPAFLRRCLRLEMPLPDLKKLEEIVKSHLGNVLGQEQTTELITRFLKLRDGDGSVATDQLLNAIYMTASEVTISGNEDLFFNFILKSLTKI